MLCVFYIQTKPEYIRQGKNNLLFLVSQTHRRRFAKSKTAAGRTSTKSRQSARQKAGTHPANCYNRYKLTNKIRAAQPLSRHSALTRAAGFLTISRIVPPLVFVLGMALIPPTLRHLRKVLFFPDYSRISLAISAVISSCHRLQSFFILPKCKKRNRRKKPAQLLFCLIQALINFFRKMRKS